MLPTKFQFIRISSFRGEDFYKIGQLETRIVCGDHVCSEHWWEAPIEGSVCIKFPQSRMKGERHFQRAKHEHLAYHNLQRTLH
jgi:hypothetical protein